MKGFWSFIKTTVKGGVFFFLPLVFLGMALEKVIAFFTKVITPIAIQLGIDNLAGKATLTILVALAIVLVCFLGGLLMRITILKRVNGKIESFLMKFVPNYQEFKERQDKKSTNKTV